MEYFWYEIFDYVDYFSYVNIFLLILVRKFKTLPMQVLKNMITVTHLIVNCILSIYTVKGTHLIVYCFVLFSSNLLDAWPFVKGKWRERGAEGEGRLQGTWRSGGWKTWTSLNQQLNIRIYCGTNIWI